jgi:DNA primase
LLRLLERRGFERDEMVEAGLVLLRQDGSGHYDRFRGRLMFPIHSESGRVVGFGGRALAPGDEPKYLNSPESPMYHKSDILFNLNRARKAIQEVGYAIVVEGYMDVIGVWSAGMANVVAPCGTSLTPHQIRALKRHAPSLILNFDPDRAGSNAAERAIGVVPVEEDMQLRICQLPGGLDPDEYVREHGPDAYRQALASAPSYWHWLADRHRSREDSASPEARSRLFQVLLREIHRVPDRVKRLAIASDLAEYTGLTQGMVLEEFRKAAAERRPVRAAAVAAPQLDPNEVLLFFALLRNPEARVQIAPYLSTLEVVRSYQSWPVLREALRLAEAGVEPSYANLEPRLEPAQRALLQSLLLDEQEQAGHSGITTAQAIACVHALAKLEKESHRSALKAQAKEAEKRGDLEEALRLSGEITRLVRGGN